MRRRLGPLLLALLAGLAARAAVLAAMDGVLPADGLYVDERVYAAGLEGITHLPLQRPPAMYALYWLLSAFGGPSGARVAMSLLSLLPALALAMVVPERGWWRWALPTAVAIQPDLLLFGTQLLPAVPAAVTAMAAILALRRGRTAAAGGLMGLACLFRAELLLALPLLFLLPPRRFSARLRIAVPWVLPVAPVLLANLLFGAGPVVSANGAENLWLGSRSELMMTPPGVEFEELVQVSSEGGQRDFLGRAADSVLASPGRWLLLGVRKTATVAALPGPGRNLEVGYLIERLRMRPLLLPMLLVLSLGVLRLLRPPESGDDLALRRALGVGALLTAFLFLPAARYRLAVMPAVWLPAASPPGRRELPGWGAVCLGVAALSLLSPATVRPGLTQIQRAERMVDEGRPEEALVSLEAAEGRGYAGADIHNLAGVSLAMAGDPEAGLRSFRDAAGLAPRSPTVWKNTAVCLAGLRRWRQASLAAKRAVELNPNLAEGLAPLLR